MDLYAEELKLDSIDSIGKENKLVGEQSHINTTYGTVGEENFTTDLSTGSTSGAHNQTIIPITELSIEIDIANKINSNEKGKSEEGNQGSNSLKEKRSGQSKNVLNPIKRKRSRNQDFKPLRESKRKRQPPLVTNYDGSDMRTRTVWTNNDKLQLLKGLKEFGVDNLKEIKTKYLPNKTTTMIHNRIRILKEHSRNELERKLIAEESKPSYASSTYANSVSKLQEWLEHFEHLDDIFPQRLFALSNVFLLISEYGDFPKPGEVEGIDLRAMYRYLHCMLNGKPHYGLNQRTADILFQSINYMFKSLKEKSSSTEMVSCLRQLAEQPLMTPHNTYTRIPSKRVLPSMESSDAISNVPNINPLNIPPHLLLKERDSEEEEEDDTNCSEDDFKSSFSNKTSLRTYCNRNLNCK